MNAAFAAFLHALPILLGFVILVGCLIGFFRGLSLRPRDRAERLPNPISPLQRLSNRFDSPPVWPRWVRRLFGRT